MNSNESNESSKSNNDLFVEVDGDLVFWMHVKDPLRKKQSECNHPVTAANNSRKNVIYSESRHCCVCGKEIFEDYYEEDEDYYDDDDDDDEYYS